MLGKSCAFENNKMLLRYCKQKISLKANLYSTAFSWKSVSPSNFPQEWAQYKRLSLSYDNLVNFWPIANDRLLGTSKTSSQLTLHFKIAALWNKPRILAYWDQSIVFFCIAVYLSCVQRAFWGQPVENSWESLDGYLNVIDPRSVLSNRLCLLYLQAVRRRLPR